MTASARLGSASRCTLLACAAGLLSLHALAVNPDRPFVQAQTLVAGRAVLFDEAEDPGLKKALGTELHRLFDDLYGRQGWRTPFAGDGPLRVYVERREGVGARSLAAGKPDRARLAPSELHVDGIGLSNARIVHETALQIARATLAAYGAGEDEFLDAAVAEGLATAPEVESRDADVWMRAAAPVVDFRAAAATLGRLWVGEVVRAAGDRAVLREAWERASVTGEPVREALYESIVEATGKSPEALLARCAARLYATIEPDVSPSRLRLLDLESGALDAAPPSELAVRHRAFLPEGAEESLRVRWPEDGGAGAAVVHYGDPALAADVVFFAAGDSRTVSLSGVARIDFLVAGSAFGGRGVAAPAYCEASATAPFRGLDAHASAGPEGPRLIWTTASHDGLWGWAIFRDEVLSDGRVARTGPQIVPSSERAEESYRYVFVDSGTTAGAFYRYTVWAVTDEGLLARGFAVTLKTSE